MANTITTEGIVGLIPTLTDPGPNYAQLITNFLQNNVAPHDHDGVLSGNLINIAGQIVANDLSLDGYNLSNTRSVQFQNQPSILSGSQDVNNIYVEQNILGFNNSNGIFVPIVVGNSLAVTSLPFTNFSIRTVSSNFTVLNTDTYNTIDINTTGGPITGTLPIAATIAPTAPGRLFLFRDISNNAGTNNITIQVAVGSGNAFGQGGTSFTINNNGGYVAIYTDGTSKWFTWTQNVWDRETLSHENTTENYTNACTINYDPTTDIIFQGGETFEGATTFSGGEVVFDNSVNVGVVYPTPWSWAGIETHGFTSTSTYQAGSNLVLNGNVNGTTSGGTLTVGSTIDITGNLNITTGNFTNTSSGTMNMNGSEIYGGSNTVSGTTNWHGLTVNATSSSAINTDRSSPVTIGDFNVYGMSVATVILQPGTTYTVDSGTNYDFYVGTNAGASGVIIVNLPASPATGRMIIVQDVSGYNNEPMLGTWSVTINGNGHGIGASLSGGISSDPNIVLSGSDSPIDYTYWSYQFVFVNNLWITTFISNSP